MKRSDTQSPCTKNIMCGYINEIWKNGGLDNFSEEHFLIQAMYNNVSKFKGYEQLSNNNANFFNFDNNFGLNFTINLSNKLEFLNKIFGQVNIKNFIEDQLSAGKNNYNEDQFFRALSEIEVLKYYCSFGPSQLSKAIYEPTFWR